MNQFKLIGAGYRQMGQSTVYKLESQMVVFRLTQHIFVQLLGASSFKFLDSNYTSLDAASTVFRSVGSSEIVKDEWLMKINRIILSEYANLLGEAPRVLEVEVSEPFYRMTYQAENGKYVFFVEYDYMQNRIVQGNITVIQKR